jgi:hypothetical protein
MVAARKRWGKRAVVEERRNAPTASERQAAMDQRKQMQARINAIAAELELAKPWDRPLLKAARFAVDVDGGEPSMSQLRQLVEAAEKTVALVDERNELRTRKERLDCFSYRWTAGRVEGGRGFDYMVVECQADTLTELLAKIESM